MIPVFQEHANDCLPAALASLLELPLGCVPNYSTRARDLHDQLAKHKRWLRGIGWTLVEVFLKKTKRGRVSAPWRDVPVPLWCIVIARVGERKGTDGLHALVGKLEGSELDIVHDPSPRSWFNPDPIAVAFLVPAIRKGESPKRNAPATPMLLPRLPARSY
jgi:hypothetical protein